MNQHSSYHNFADIKRLDFIFDTLKSIPENGKVLDVGCGNGIISMSLGEKGYNVHGIDVSASAVQTASSRNTMKNVRFEKIDAEQLALSGVQYDAIICSEVLEHLYNPGSLLSKLNELLKEDGKLVVTVPNGFGPREVIVTKPMIYFRKKATWIWKGIEKVKRLLGYSGTTVQSAAEDLDHIQFFTKRELKSLSKSHSFSIVKFRNANFIYDVFPFSFISNRIKYLQKLDCQIADFLPYTFTGGFLTVWEKR